jgi:pSer/pThr/pTyr-binding forkhead associated (FHA) protein
MQVVIGRLGTNALALDDPEVSGTHLILRWLEPDDGSPCCWQV